MQRQEREPLSGRLPQQTLANRKELDAHKSLFGSPSLLRAQMEIKSPVSVVPVQVSVLRAQMEVNSDGSVAQDVYD